ncbi:hypothetical protein e2701_00086 [Klebsiella phage e270.1]|nr:hypothetical protein phi270_00042 [Klebsiella phage phi_270]WMT10645.1 hypothetical protein e2701_00086 [Klebsiella phage e270.1]WMT10731.1 hypothetical protein e2702_00085 [Klebsiella phage e270.2]
MSEQYVYRYNDVNRVGDGNPTPYGKWHNVFARQYLQLGKFKTNSQGNLQHIETGDTDYQNYLVPPSEVSKP